MKLFTKIRLFLFGNPFDNFPDQGLLLWYKEKNNGELPWEYLSLSGDMWYEDDVKEYKEYKRRLTK